MAKATPDAVLDLPLTEIATGTVQHVCSAEPANYAGIAAVSLADVTLTAGDGAGDFVIADGDVSGRKVTVGAQTAVPIDASGDATHVVIADVAGTQLLQVTTCTTQTLTSGGTVDVGAYAITFSDPT